MNKIVSKEHFSANVVKLEVEAPLIARSRKAGHFVIVKVGEKGERIPLTIAGADTQKGTITLVIQAVGGSSKKICDLNVGDYITDLVGPLGQATHIEKVGTVVCAGGGVGVAPLLPIVEAFHKAPGDRCSGGPYERPGYSGRTDECKLRRSDRYDRRRLIRYPGTGNKRRRKCHQP